MEIWEPKPSGTLWATPDLLRDCCMNCESRKVVHLAASSHVYVSYVGLRKENCRGLLKANYYLFVVNVYVA